MMMTRGQTSTVALPEVEPDGAKIVGYLCDSIGRKRERVAADDNATMQAKLRLVDFDAMPGGWFIVVRKAPSK